MGKNRMNRVMMSNGTYEKVVAMQDGVTLTADVNGSLWNYTNVKFTGDWKDSSSDFQALKKVEYTVTRSVANASVVENYAIEVGNAEFTLPVIE
jgi:hypothetical protein